MRELAGAIADATRAAYADDARQPYYESRRAAYDNGYREGAKEGEHDGRRRDTYTYQDERTWQRADKGYNRSFGDRERYQQTFRTASRPDTRTLTGATHRDGGERGQRRRLSEHAAGGYDTPIRAATAIQHRAATRARLRHPGPITAAAATATARHTRTVLHDGIREGPRGCAQDRDSTIRSVTSGIARAITHYKSPYGSSASSTQNVYRQGFKEGYERGYREWRYSGSRGCSRSRRIGVRSGRGTGHDSAGMAPASDRSSRSRRNLFIRPETSPGLGGGAFRVASRTWASSARRVIAARPICSTAFGSAAPSAGIPPRQLEHGRVAAGHDRRRPRLAGQQRHLAEVAARHRSPRPRCRRARAPRPTAPEQIMNIDCPASPCRTIGSPVPNSAHHGAARDVAAADRPSGARTDRRVQAPARARLLLRRGVGLGPVARVADLDRPRDLDAAAREGVEIAVRTSSRVASSCS